MQRTYVPVIEPIDNTPSPVIAPPPPVLATPQETAAPAAPKAPAARIAPKPKTPELRKVSDQLNRFAGIGIKPDYLLQAFVGDFTIDYDALYATCKKICRENIYLGLTEDLTGGSNPITAIWELLTNSAPTYSYERHKIFHPWQLLALSSSKKTLEELLSLPNFQTLEDNTGMSVWSYLILQGDITRLAIVLKRFPSLKDTAKKTDVFGRTPLHFAALSGSKQMLNYIAALYPEMLEQEDKYKRIITLFAALSDSVAALLEATKLVDKTTHRDVYGFNICLLAAFSGSLDVMHYTKRKYPLQCGSKSYKRDLNVALVATLARSVDVLKNVYAMFPGSFANAEDNRGRGILHYAVNSGSMFMVEFVMELARREKVRAYREHTPLSDTMIKKLDKNDESFIDWIIGKYDTYRIQIHFAVIKSGCLGFEDYLKYAFIKYAMLDYLLSREDNELKLNLLNNAMDKNHALGQLFWMPRNIGSPDMDSGALKQLKEAYDALLEKLHPFVEVSVDQDAAPLLPPTLAAPTLTQPTRPVKSLLDQPAAFFNGFVGGGYCGRVKQIEEDRFRLEPATAIQARVQGILQEYKRSWRQTFGVPGEDGIKRFQRFVTVSRQIDLLALQDRNPKVLKEKIDDTQAAKEAFTLLYEFYMANGGHNSTSRLMIYLRNALMKISNASALPFISAQYSADSSENLHLDQFAHFVTQEAGLRKKTDFLMAPLLDRTQHLRPIEKVPGQLLPPVEAPRLYAREVDELAPQAEEPGRSPRLGINNSP